MEVKPGYKQTEVGVIPEDWNISKLSEHVSFKTGPFGSALHKSDYVADGIPVINPMQIVDGRILPTRTMAITEEAARNLSDFRLSFGNIVIGRRGEMGRCALVGELEEGWLCGTGSMIIRTRDSVDGAFLQRILSSRSIIKAIENSSVGTTMINLNQNILGSLIIALPPTISEQEAIAEALSDADALIESLEQLIAKKRQIKQGAMQELLRPKDGWEVKRFGDFGSTFGGLTGKSKADFGRGEARYITFMNVMSNVVIDCDSFEKVVVSPAENQNSVQCGDIFFNGSSETPEEVGLCSVLNSDVNNVYLNSFCFGFRIRNSDELDGLYAAYFFRSGEGREALKSLAQGATRYNLSKTSLMNLSFPVPPTSEQKSIALILSEMDTEIDALEAKLTKVRQVKQGMMQELLTGRVRLV